MADGLNVLQHKILAPLGFAAEFVADKLGGWVSNITMVLVEYSTILVPV